MPAGRPRAAGLSERHGGTWSRADRSACTPRSAQSGIVERSWRVLSRPYARRGRLVKRRTSGKAPESGPLSHDAGRMRALVTGATGKVGNAVARALAARGDEVRVLVRDPARAAPLLPEGVESLRGDVTDPASLASAVEGCEVVFNAMGLPEQFLGDPETFERLNARG